MFGLNLLGVKVGQPASPENTSWLDMEEVNKTGKDLIMTLCFTLILDVIVSD